MNAYGRVALVHDYLNQYGGAERVLEALHELYPDAPVYTSIYDPAAMPASYARWDIRTSWMQRIPAWRKHFRKYFLLYPSAFEAFDLSAYDLVISSSSAYAKGIIPKPGALHVCYCHTPMRFAWRTDDYVEREAIGGRASGVLAVLLTFLRVWDVVSAKRVDVFVANSREVAGRIRHYYGQPAAVIPPPVDLAPYTALAPEDFYLTGGRLVPYKRIDLVVQAFTAMKLPLVVFGSGRDRAKLEALAGPTVRFVGRVDDAELQRLYQRCRAYITAGDEDAGIQPVEAMAAGRPVIAYAAGGVRETVIDGVTGCFFHEQTPAALAVAVAHSRAATFDPLTIRRHAEQFGRERFKQRMAEFIAEQRNGKYDVLASSSRAEH
ncbi:MAG: glycosyltransferase [Chloroflexota bacterium]|nr:glycosyltransferase [Chloroflexota bacterium]PLS79554.1 MAG: glycosyl transferase [Chloroflexota bacterium]